MPHIKVNDLLMYYEQHGQGDTVILIGGFSADHTVWSAVIPYLKEHYQVIALDNRGAGQTDIPEGPYSIEQMADDVASLCFELGIKKAHVVGSSMGGYIAQSLAVHHPQLINSIVLCNSVGGMRTTFRLYIEAQLDMRKAKVSDEILIKAACSWLFSYQFLAQPGVLELLMQMGLNNPYPFTDKGYEAQLEALRQFDSAPWLKHIKVPTLVLAGDQDLVFHEFLVQDLANKIHNARYYCFSECGHLPQIEHPELFAQIVHEFIEQLPG
jgi:3-oxoadipate enol-lactonase